MVNVTDEFLLNTKFQAGSQKITGLARTSFNRFVAGITGYNKANGDVSSTSHSFVTASCQNGGTCSQSYPLCDIKLSCSKCTSSWDCNIYPGFETCSPISSPGAGGCVTTCASYEECGFCEADFFY